MKQYQDIATMLLRLATGANFLSPVASRLGFWGQQSSGWDEFIVYAGQVNSFAPQNMIYPLAIVATLLESLFGVLLIIGYTTRWVSLGASALTFIFAMAMTYSFGIKSPLDYSVFVDCTSAFLLATQPSYRWSIDEWIVKKIN
ncbi:MAG: DoxX family protein [Bacteroidales bacterium]|nr:DoxX family protein [Bacteroidales bacterium]